VASADATMLDTTGMSVDDVVERVLRVARALI
jgi:cytidylate kinase